MPPALPSIWRRWWAATSRRSFPNQLPPLQLGREGVHREPPSPAGPAGRPQRMRDGVSDLYPDRGRKGTAPDRSRRAQRAEVLR
eukprot:3809035-Alexandrium_andersonii.AAC.1